VIVFFIGGGRRRHAFFGKQTDRQPSGDIMLLPAWLVSSLPGWLLAYLIVSAVAATWLAIRFRDVRKFLAGAFFVSSGMLAYFWATGTSVPIVMPFAGTVAVEPPGISGYRAIVHFLLFVTCLYFGYLNKSK
jgi:integral membrane sensor domain MASE1